MLSVANAIVGANYWVVAAIVILVQACNNWGDEIWAPPKNLILNIKKLENPMTYLFSYKLVETSFENTDAFISLPSFNLYMFILNFINELLKIGIIWLAPKQRICTGTLTMSRHRYQDQIYP